MLKMVNPGDDENAMQKSYFASPISAHGRHAGKIPTKDIYITFVDRRPNMIELGDECMFEPVHEHFREHDRQHGLMAGISACSS